jgi:hypothetical protein
MTQIGNTEALEAYLKLEQENQEIAKELEIYKKELTKMRIAYANISTDVNTLFGWLESTGDYLVRRKMAELFKFAYMEAEFEDLRAKWSNDKEATKQ